MEEIYNFSQDDLLTEDMLILDTHAEVFVWVGQSVNSKEKQSALDIGQVLGIFHFQCLNSICADGLLNLMTDICGDGCFLGRLAPKCPLIQSDRRK